MRFLISASIALTVATSVALPAHAEDPPFAHRPAANEAPASVPKPQEEKLPLKGRFSKKMTIAGAVLTGIGGFALLVSLPPSIDGALCNDDCSGHSVEIWPMVAIAGSLVATGIPLLAVGMMPVRGRATVALSVAPNGIGLRGSF